MVGLDLERQKALAARAAAACVEDGQVVGLGTGTTVAYLLSALGERARAGLRFTGVSTSDATERIAAGLGLSLSDLDHHPRLDLAIDGADEVAPNLDLIKGRGGALLREKIVASAARRFIVVADETKIVRRLGEHAPTPVEIVPFGQALTRARLAELGAEVELRGGEQPYRTENGNFIADCRFADLADPARVAAQVKSVTGVVEHGFFLAMASLVLIGHSDGTLTRLGA